MHGRFIITSSNGQKFIVPNTIVAEGAEAYFAQVFQAVALSTFYVGLCNQIPDNADTLVDITTEPTVLNGYARQPLLRNGTDWPTIATVDGETSVLSKQVDFTASGGDFDAPITRLFLCDVLSGSVGTLFSYSAALPAELTVADGSTWSAQYEMFTS